MKLSEYQAKILQDPDYAQAMNELKLHFKIGTAVLQARIQKGMSQEAVAAAAGTKQANISRIESGMANPTLSLLNRLFDILEIHLELTHAGPDPIHYSIAQTQSRQNPIAVSNWPRKACNSAYDTSVSAPVLDGELR